MQPLAAPVGAALLTAGTCAFVLWADPTTPGGATPPCPTKVILGITCPGCGSARMLYSLLHADLAAALHFNAVGVLAVLVLMWTYAVWLASRAIGRRLPRWQEQRWAPAAVLVVVSAWAVARMIPVEPFRSLQV